MRIIDISQGWHEGMPKFDAGWYPEFRIDRVMTPESDPVRVGRTFSQLHLFPHNGSHVESGFHFFPDGAKIATVSLERFVGPACLADVSHRRDLEPVTAGDLEKAVGDVWRPGMRLLIRTDHPRRHVGGDDYWDTAAYIDSSAAAWIVQHETAVVGMDCITEKPGSRDFPIHRMLLSHEIPILENLANLHEVTDPVVWLFAAPVKVENVEAAPVRAIAIEGLPC
jgi:arylformamidase